MKKVIFSVIFSLFLAVGATSLSFANTPETVINIVIKDKDKDKDKKKKKKKKKKDCCAKENKSCEGKKEKSCEGKEGKSDKKDCSGH